VAGISPEAATRTNPDELPAGLTRDDWGEIRRSIQRSEYHACRVARGLGAGTALQASNPQQAYRTRFRREGIEIVPQASTRASWRLGLSATGYGYEGDVRALEAAEPRSEQERVEYRRGLVTEWYVNRPGGLEQGFELDEPQPRRAGPLVVAMAVEGDLDVSARGDSVSFTHGSDETLRYADLKAWDAEGRPLAARVEAVGREVRLVVEAQTARFPVTVDPTFFHEAQLFGHDPVDPSNAWFGSSVAVDGDTLVVGARGSQFVQSQDPGSAYVFVRSGTTWTEQQKLTASDGAANDAFGISVSVAGDTLVVGSYFNDSLPGTGREGAAYVFVRSGTTWTEQQKLTAPDGAHLDLFGISVSVSDDTVVVGAAWHDAPGGGDEGAAYVFARSGTTWTLQQEILAPDAAPSDGFGGSVALSGDTAVISAVGDDSSAGSVYVFVRSGAIWTQQQKIPASLGAYFGNSVSISGDTLVAGAIGYQQNAGVAYVFVRSGTTWTQQQQLLASDLMMGAAFGDSVSISGDTVVVGAPGAAIPGGAQAGAMYVFSRSGTTWTEQQKLFASDGEPVDAFGSAVSVSGDTAVAGALEDDTAGAVDAGSVHVYREEHADLSVAKSDGQLSAVPGEAVSYAIVVANAGPTFASAAVTDTVPAALQGATWTCAASPGSSCTALGSGSINDSVDLLAGGSATYTLAGTIDPAATGVLANTAAVSAPAGVDPDPGNDSATDTDTLTPRVDLSVTKTDGQTAAIPGGLVTYTIAVTNAGPSAATGATLTDLVPATLLGATWTCTAPLGSTCAANGSGSINDTVGLLAGGTVSYALTGTVDPAATGTLVNTATAAAPGGATDPNPANNSATDTDTLLPSGLSIEGELLHGYRRQHDLAALPGPVADEDLFRIFQRPHASYEVLLDGASGDIGAGSGPFVERLASDASTVVQGSSPAGAGGSRSLRWMNALDTPVADQLVRVRSAGCTTTCDAADVYRLSALETTGVISRFNNSATQITVLLLQNESDEALDVDIRFWSGTGASLGGPPIQTLGPRQVYVLNTSTIAPASSGSITVANTGRYGQLAGKAVAIEAATGFSFDTALTGRPR
jgi:uncharacterized repeat protein (TIGR01451 family)